MPPVPTWIDHIGGPKTLKGIGISTGVSALFALGPMITRGPLKDASPGTKRLVDAVFGVEMARRILIPDLHQAWHERNVPDFVMTALTSVIAALGVSTNDRSMIQSAAMLSALFAMAGKLEEGVLAKNVAGIEALEKSVPTQVMRRVPTDTGYRHETINLGQVREGDHLVVPHGETVPVDGHVLEVHTAGKPNGAGAVTMPRALSGEHNLIKITAGERVPQGAIAAEGSELVVKAAAHARESTILRNVDYLREAEKTAPARAIHSVERAVNNIYIPLMLAACGAQFAYTYWYEHKKEDKKKEKHEKEGKKHKEHGSLHHLRKSVKRTAELAIKMAPCAITAAMLVMPFVKNRLASGCGVIVREDAALEKTKNITHILTDIRGTLTKGLSEFKGLHLWDEAKGLVACESAAEHELLGVIGKTQSTSAHPLAKSLRAAAEQRGHTLDLKSGEAIHIHPGLGVVGQMNEAEVMVGSRHLMMQQGHEVPAGMLQASEGFQDAAYWRVRHASGHTQWGCAAFEDPLRPEVVDAIQDLRKRGIKVVLVTGMQEKAAGRIAAAIDNASFPHNPIEVRAERIHLGKEGIPGKDDVVREFSRPDRTLAAVGDGENDAPFMSLVKQHGGVSFAIGNTGAGATKEVASMVVEGIHQLPGLMTLSKRLSQALWINMSAAGAWMSFLVGSHVFGIKMSPQQASVAHEAPTFLLTLAALWQNFGLVKGVPTSISQGR